MRITPVNRSIRCPRCAGMLSPDQVEPGSHRCLPRLRRWRLKWRRRNWTWRRRRGA